MFREHDPRQSERDGPAELFQRHLDLPAGPQRERVGDHSLRGSESRVLATVGAFRAIPKDELLADCGASERDLDRLRQTGLVSTSSFLSGHRRTTIVTLTESGLQVVEDNRRPVTDHRPQRFYAGISRPRELGHDMRVFSAYVDARERLTRGGGRIRRVVLEQELKSDYQRFLQEPADARARTRRRHAHDVKAVADWAASQHLPVIDDSVRFPDARIEYDRPDGTFAREDIEIVTEHYRGAHGARTSAAGFRCYRSKGQLGGARSSTKGGRSPNPRLAEEML